MENLRRASIGIGEFLLRGALLVGIGKMLFVDYHQYFDSLSGQNPNNIFRAVLLGGALAVISSGSWFNKEKKAQVEEDDTE